MKKIYKFVMVIVLVSGPILFADTNEVAYCSNSLSSRHESYEGKGCCPSTKCCDPCAYACGTDCGLSVLSIAAAIAAVVGVAAVILSQHGVHSHNHTH